MIYENPDNAQFIKWMIITLVSAWGGVVRYITDVKNDKVEWRWGGVFFQVIVSAFTGVLGGLLSFEMGSSIYMTCAIAGLFGAIGSGAIDQVAYRIFAKNGVK